MKLSFAATNPCHLYPLALEIGRLGALGEYYSGYPAWKLPHSGDVRSHLQTHSLRTLVVYGLLKYAPEGFRPASRSLFVWQDRGFDRWVGQSLKPCDDLHGIPGQCLHAFRAARAAGIRTVLNHATGPAREWVRIMAPEYDRAGLRLADVCPYDETYFEREDEEYALADLHCAASTVVRDQLAAQGVPESRIWVVPYGADRGIFRPAPGREVSEFRIVFAGQLTMRKGIKTVLDALQIADHPEWEAHFHGTQLPESAGDFRAYIGATPVRLHGAVSQAALATAFQEGSVLVLPSLEEGFGLVVPQALSCGMPVIVSDRTGAKDLIRHRENGSMVPVGDPAALGAELQWWSENRRRVEGSFDWTGPARTLIALSARAQR